MRRRKERKKGKEDEREEEESWAGGGGFLQGEHIGQLFLSPPHKKAHRPGEGAASLGWEAPILSSPRASERTRYRVASPTPTRSRGSQKPTASASPVLEYRNEFPKVAKTGSVWKATLRILAECELREEAPSSI
ncbi:hypothetical protein E2320_006713, partial [Naja naja]